MTIKVPAGVVETYRTEECTFQHADKGFPEDEPGQKLKCDNGMAEG